MRRTPAHGVMDHLDKAREHMVEAMGCLEQALLDGLPAQSPHSDARQIAEGIEVFKKRIGEALAFVERAENALKQARP